MGFLDERRHHHYRGRVSFRHRRHGRRTRVAGGSSGSSFAWIGMLALLQAGTLHYRTLRSRGGSLALMSYGHRT